MLRIIAFIYTFYPYLGGSALGMYDLLKRLSDKGVVITVLTCNDVSGIDLVGGMIVIRLASWKIAGIYPLPKPTITNIQLLRFVCKNDYDLAYTRTRFFFTTFIGLCVSYYKRIPLLHTEPGSGAVHWDNKIINLIARLWDMTIGRMVVKRAACIGVSEASSAFVKTLGGSNVKTIYNGIDKGVFYAERKDKSLVCW